MIGIIGAMNIEVEALRAHMEAPETRVISGIEFTSGLLSGVPAVVSVCGIGKVLAGLTAEIMCLCYDPSLIINTGVAGSLSPKLHIGDILVSESAVQHDLDTTVLGDPAGYVQSLDLTFVPADEKACKVMLEAAGALGLSAIPGIVATGDQFVSDQRVKNRLVRKFGATACEMEGAAIAVAARTNSVPFVILRAISDGANDGAPLDFPSFAKLAAANSVRVLEYALPKLNRPDQRPGL